MIEIDELIEKALKEDIGDQDITTTSIIRSPRNAAAHLIAKETIILAGIDLFHQVFTKLDSEMVLMKYFEDGDKIGLNSTIAELRGDVAAILQGERVALNFLQRLSGIATLTHSFVTKVKAYSVKILDTRKTTPGWRFLEKYAVKMGGGRNHRFGLFDAVLIKDNHINVAGGVGEAIKRVRAVVPAGVNIEVEVQTLQEVREALEGGVHSIMLDNMDTGLMKEAVKMVNKRIGVEASGNISLANVEEVARTGVDFISIGALTHSAPAADVSLKII